MRWKRLPATLAGLTICVASVSHAVAEKVRGTETCTAGSWDRTINGKKYTCATKCTTPVTDTTCNPNCSTTVYNEVTYKDCTEKAAGGRRPGIDFRAPPPAGLLETDPGTGGGGRPGATGPVRPTAPAQRLQ